MDQALNSQKTPHTSPLRASYGMSFVSILMKNDRVIKGFYCILKMTCFFQEPKHGNYIKCRTVCGLRKLIGVLEINFTEGPNGPLEIEGFVYDYEFN